MKTQQQLNSILERAASALTSMRPIAERHRADEAALKADDSRSESYKTTTTREMRDATVGSMAEAHATLRTIAGEAAAARRFWGSTELVLSRRRFSSDPAIDAAMRSARLAEFSRLGSETLALIADAAKEDGDLATFWTAHVANRDHRDSPGFVAIPLALEIPEQKAALDSIDETERHLARADHMVAEVMGRSVEHRLGIAGRLRGSSALEAAE